MCILVCVCAYVSVHVFVYACVFVHICVCICLCECVKTSGDFLVGEREVTCRGKKKSIIEKTNAGSEGTKPDFPCGQLWI